MHYFVAEHRTLSPVSIQTQSLALRALRKRKPQEMQALALASSHSWLPLQALAFLAVFVYATHATQAIAFEWKPGFILSVNAEPYVGRERSAVRFRCSCLSRRSTRIVYELRMHGRHAESVETTNVRRQSSSVVLLPRPSGCRQ